MPPAAAARTPCDELFGLGVGEQVAAHAGVEGAEDLGAGGGTVEHDDGDAGRARADPRGALDRVAVGVREADEEDVGGGDGIECERLVDRADGAYQQDARCGAQYVGQSLADDRLVIEHEEADRGHCGARDWSRPDRLALGARLDDRGQYGRHDARLPTRPAAWNDLRMRNVFP